MQSIEMQKACEQYEKLLKQLKEDRDLLEMEYREERHMMKSTMEERNEEHSIAIIELESKLNEKILAESEKYAALKVQMDEQKNEYEKMLNEATVTLNETIDMMEKKFAERYNEREEKIRTLLGEIQTKKEEFFHYCSQLNLDNDRKIAQLNLSFENRIRETEDDLLKWRTEASILTKKIATTSKTCEQLRADIAILLDEHSRNKKLINQLEQNIVELQRDIDIKNKLVIEKDKCLMEAIEKAATAEKTKKFLNERAVQLETQIGPLEDKIKELSCKISEMLESKQKLLRKNENRIIEIQMLKNSCKAISADLKAQKAENDQLKTLINRMCSDISELAQHIQDLPKLKELTLDLFKRLHFYRYDKCIIFIVILNLDFCP